MTRSSPRLQQEDGGSGTGFPAASPTVAGVEPAQASGTARPRPVSAGGSVAKRAMDMVLAALGLALSAPVWAVIAAAVKLQDGGAVFYSQQRVGRGGELFRSHKFRSMSPRSRDPDVPGQAELEDHRITRVGRLLRATALDELPQLWNILRGDMSFVGPRALLSVEEEANGDGDPEHLHEITGFEERHAVRPGLTGLAQVYASRDLPRRQKFRYDLLYVRKRSLRLDLYLFVKSVWISLRGKWPEVGHDGDSESESAEKRDVT